jgi:LuxR family transcriptional regulator, maltose regulon positive regulatory protein
VAGEPVKRSRAPRTPLTSGGDERLPAAPPAAISLDPGLGASKLCRPECRADAVLRRRLVNALLRETASLIIVSAPSGAGKTLAVTQWLDVEERPAAWLHLDGGDNDPVTLLQYLARALEEVAPVPPAVHSWLRLPHPPLAEAILPALLLAVGAAPPFALVLDDVHRVRDERCWQVVWQLIASLSDGSVAALCGRTDPPLPLARFRAEGLLAEFRAAQLSFDAAELEELLKLRGLEARPDLVADLLETAEGWAAGSYLAVVALGRPDARDVVLTTTTAAHEVEDYLSSEVLAEQPAEIIDFLTRTSIVDHISPELCDALTGRSDSAAMLERAEKDNLFVVPLDRERGWYRYHRLFSLTLRAELRRRAPDDVTDLHRRAAAWFQERDHVREAVHHWLAAGDLPAAGDLVSRRWLSRYDDGRLLTARLWLDEFAPGQESGYAPLTVAGAWVRALSGQAAEASHQLGQLDSAALDVRSPDGTASLRSSAALVSAILGGAGPASMLELAHLARRLEREQGHISLWLDFANLLVGVAEAVAGDADAAIVSLEAAARRGSVIRSSAELAALGQLSLLAGDEGRWEEAERYAFEAAEKAAAYELEDYLLSVPARVARDRMSARAGDADAVADLVELLESADSRLCPWVAPQIALVLAEIAVDRGEAPEARRWLAEARLRLERWAAHALVHRCDMLKARLAGRVLAEPVSTAELRVLELLPTYLTLSEIAARLTVSPNTVGTHVRSLHRKLGATSRSGTVQRAVDLGILAAPRRSPDD